MCFTDAKIQNFIKREKSYKFSLRAKFRPIFSIVNTKIDWIGRINVRHFSRFNNMPFFPVYLPISPYLWRVHDFSLRLQRFLHDFIITMGFRF